MDLLSSRINRLPSWLRIVATTRNEQNVLNQLRGLTARELDAHDEQNLSDVRRFIAGRLTAATLQSAVIADGRSGEVLTEKLQATLAAVQKPQADQHLVGYHRGRRPLAEEEVSQASSSGLIIPGEVPKGSAPLVIVEEGATPELEIKERRVLSDEPEVRTPEVKVIATSDEWVPSASGLNETLFDKLANLIESFRRPKASKRVAVAVSKDVFSRVSHLAFSRELDKIDILTFLLHRHLSDIKADKIPKWLLVESKGPNRVDYLSFLQTPDLTKKIALLQERLGLNKVDIVEKHVLQWLPRAPFTIPAKQEESQQGLVRKASDN